MKRQAVLYQVLFVLLLAVGIYPVMAAENIFENPTFIGAEDQIPPPGWEVYGVLKDGNTITLVDGDDPVNRGLHIVDGVSSSKWAGQIGLTQTVNCQPNQSYRLSAKVKALAEGATEGAFLQLRFLPSNQVFQVALTTTTVNEFAEISVDGLAPAGTTQARVNLWTAAPATPDFIVSQITLTPVATGNILINPAFADAAKIPPPGWLLYGTMKDGNTITFVNADDPKERAVFIADRVSIPRGYAGELGLQQTVPGSPGQAYRLSAWIKGSHYGSDGAYLQLRFLPSNKNFQIELNNVSATEFEEVFVEGVAPDDTTEVRVYIYSQAGPTPQFYVREVILQPIAQ